MGKITLDQLKNLTGRITENNILTLQKYASLCVNGNTPVIIADIGTLAGMSAISMAAVSPHITVHTCDPNHTSRLDEQLEEYHMKDQIKYYEMDSYNFSKVCPRSLDMIFIDGVHNYGGVSTDILNTAILVKQGGYICFHDYNIYKDEIDRAVEEYRDKIYTFIEHTGINPDPTIREGSVWVGKRI